jgi:hypothetical protein
LATLIGLTLLVTACHSGRSKGSDATTPGSGSSGSSQNATDAGLKYGQCMRAHGVTNFPEPNGDPGAPQTGGPVDIGSQQYQNAEKICAPLVAGVKGNAPSQNPQNQAKLLQYAQCMRSHGVTNFPDPNSNGGFTLGGGQVGGSGGTGVDTTSAQYQSAAKACQSLLPAGS